MDRLFYYTGSGAQLRKSPMPAQKKQGSRTNSAAPLASQKRAEALYFIAVGRTVG
jgi:hypothetical protein